MNSPSLFENLQFGQLRTHLDAEGIIWFCGKDILESLDYVINNDTSKHMSHVPEEWRGSKPIPTPGGTQDMLCLTEQGIYFFLGRSDKPKALPYQKWVAGEVIPSIRKTGVYTQPHDFNANLLCPSYRKPFPFQRRILKIVEGAPYKIGTSDVSATYIQMRLGPGMVTADRLREMLRDLLAQGFLEAHGYTPPRGPETVHYCITSKGREYLGLISSSNLFEDCE